MRAVDKRFGPERFVQYSIGVLHHLHVDLVKDELVLRQKSVERDGTWLIMNTILWVMKKVSAITAFLITRARTD